MKSISHTLSLILAITTSGIVKIRGEEVKKTVLENAISAWVSEFKLEPIIQQERVVIKVIGEDKWISIELNCKKVFAGWMRGNGARPGRIKHYKSVPKSDGILVNVRISRIEEGQGDSWNAIVYRKLLEGGNLTPELKWTGRETFWGFLSSTDHSGQNLGIWGQVGNKVGLENRRRIMAMIRVLSEKLPDPQFGTDFFKKFETPKFAMQPERKPPILRANMRTVELSEVQLTEISKTGSIDLSTLQLAHFFGSKLALPKLLKVNKAFTQAERNRAEGLGGSIQCFWVEPNRLDIFNFSVK